MTHDTELDSEFALHRGFFLSMRTSARAEGECRSVHAKKKPRLQCKEAIQRRENASFLL